MDLLTYFALIPALGVTAQWIAWRTKLPAILLLLGFGIILGQFVSPDELLAEKMEGAVAAGPNILFPIVSLAVAIILFEGGLSLKLSELRESGSATLRLVTLGAAITMALTSILAHYILKFPWQLSLLLGAILTVTGPTVIGPMLQQIRPRRRVAAVLKWEGIVIDPIGAVLAVLVFEEAVAIHASIDLAGSLWLLTKIIAVGTLIGIAGGIFFVQAIRRYWIPDNLQGIASLAITMALFSLSNRLAEESGLITVTVLGVWITNRAHGEIRHVVEFKEHLRTLLIGCLFILLGSRLDPMNVVRLGWPGFLFLLAMILVVRPISVFVSLIGTAFTREEKTFIAMLAPRGIVAAAVSSLFALKLLNHEETSTLAGVNSLVDVTFLVIIGTVTFYGLCSGWLARYLKLAQLNPQGLLIAGADPWVREFAKLMRQEKIPVLLVDANYNKIAAAKMEGIPAECINILSDQAQEDLDLGGIGRLLAMTQNDEVNSLATLEFRHLFDSSELYQLSYTKTEGRLAASGALSGRTLISEGVTYSRLKERFESGARWKKTKLTEDFNWKSFLEKNTGVIKLICSIDEDKIVRINTVDKPLSPLPGQTVIAMIGDPERSETDHQD